MSNAAIQTTDDNAEAIDDNGLDLVSAFFETEEVAESDDSSEADDDADTGEVDGDQDGDKPEDDADADDEADDEAEDEDSDDEDAKDDDGEAVEMFTVKAHGKEFEVPLDELVAGYSRDVDYRQKTQAHAETVRAWQAEQQQEVAALKDNLQYWAVPTSKQPQPEDFVGKPDQFMAAYDKWKQSSDRQSQAQELLNQINEAERVSTIQREADLLQAAIPEWADETVRDSDFKRMMEFAKTRYGVDQAEIMQNPDHRILMLLRDASRVAELDAKPVVLKRKTEVKPKMKAGSKTTTDTKAAARKRAEARVASGNASDVERVNAFFVTDD